MDSDFGNNYMDTGGNIGSASSTAFTNKVPLEPPGSFKEALVGEGLGCFNSEPLLLDNDVVIDCPASSDEELSISLTNEERARLVAPLDPPVEELVEDDGTGPKASDEGPKDTKLTKDGVSLGKSLLPSKKISNLVNGHNTKGKGVYVSGPKEAWRKKSLEIGQCSKGLDNPNTLPNVSTSKTDSEIAILRLRSVQQVALMERDFSLSVSGIQIPVELCSNLDLPNMDIGILKESHLLQKNFELPVSKDKGEQQKESKEKDQMNTLARRSLSSTNSVNHPFVFGARHQKEAQSQRRDESEDSFEPLRPVWDKVVPVFYALQGVPLDLQLSSTPSFDSLWRDPEWDIALWMLTMQANIMSHLPYEYLLMGSDMVAARADIHQMVRQVLVYARSSWMPDYANLYHKIDLHPMMLDQGWIARNPPPRPGEPSNPPKPSMSILLWNCRGVRNPDCVRDFLDLVRLYNPDVLVLTETRARICDAQSILNRLPFDGFMDADVIGFQGGIWMLWRTDRVLVGTSEQEIHVVVKVSSFPSNFLFSAIYASPRRKERHILWDNLRLVSNHNNLSWLAAGDFNEIGNFYFPKLLLPIIPSGHSDHCPILINLDTAGQVKGDKPFRF
ncbi:Endonuclease/exonuclease/phosphatase [Corchorus olitorius]|uniref:Endonuclease/exonuclease/phosphatase n=1 Tax=Corchorus olitorius TaxID=93759 RepID=A0A1R3IZN6_9ROSI|nr:Endonuclease/exonuclease/phosphatase [Corchorus olitorius]